MMAAEIYHRCNHDIVYPHAVELSIKESIQKTFYISCTNNELSYRGKYMISNSLSMVIGSYLPWESLIFPKRGVANNHDQGDGYPID